MDEIIEIVEISLVAPCFNEAGNVEVLAERFLNTMHEAQISCEIVFVDDGSSDGTWEILKELEKSNKMIRAEFHETNQGIARGWTTGIENSRGRLVCLIDSDLQNPPEEVLKLYEASLTNECDLVQGVRVPVNKHPLSRRVMSQGLNVILNKVFGMNARDNKSGFVLASRECLIEVMKRELTYHHFQTFIAVSAFKRGFIINEVETNFENRISGDSYLSGRTVRTTFEAIIDIVRARREFNRAG